VLLVFNSGAPRAFGTAAGSGHEWLAEKEHRWILIPAPEDSEEDEI
jgi:hypothetical protein